jgi:hypothetical protein
MFVFKVGHWDIDLTRVDGNVQIDFEEEKDKLS